MITINDMNCPNCKKELLDKAIFYGVEVDYCPKCLGIWFEDEELRWAKDEKDKKLNWLDIDLWKNTKKFAISRGGRACPVCRMPLYEIEYDKSQTKVDLCNLCKGIWLDRGEFRKIINYLKEKADYETLYRYSKNIAKEFWEIFTGPETFREEVIDVITLLKLFNYKFVSQHPNISQTISQLPK